MNLAFLKSNRFWLLVVGAVALYLQQKGFVGEAELALIVTISGGFISIRTVDRFGEQLNKK